MSYVGQFSLENLIPGIRGNSIGSNLGDIDLSGVTTIELPAGTTLGGSSLTALGTITSTSANALAVGRQGTTNPVLQIDASTSTVATGIKIKGAAAAAGVAVSVITSGTNENLTVDAAGSGTVTINGTATGNVQVGGGSSNPSFIVDSNSATSLVVGPNGATNPVLTVVSSTSSQASGLSITGAATGVALALAVTDSGSNAGITIDGKGSGIVNIGSISTGIVIASRGAHKALVDNSLLTAGGTVQNTTPTAAQLIGGFFSHNSATGAGTCTLDNGTNISAAVSGVAVGDSFTCIFANTGSQTVTLTGATGSTIVGTAAVPTGKNATMTFYNTGSNTWNVYCMVSA